MRSIQTTLVFPLASVKPLEGLLAYRAHCVAATRKALEGSHPRRRASPVDGAPLELIGNVEGLAYGRCRSGGGIFLAELPDPEAWSSLLADVSRHRQSPKAFHADLAQSRTDHVYAPKLEWIRDTLRLQGLRQPIVLEVITRPSDFTPLLQDSGVCSEVVTVDETELVRGGARVPAGGAAEAAILLESLDRSDDPRALLRAVLERLSPGGLIFATGLVASGFDLATLGLANLYLYPPDRANCFSLRGLSTLLQETGLTLLEVSTPGVLDVEILEAHVKRDPSIPLSAFERQLLEAGEETRDAFQTFLQQQGLSSFARIVARKPADA